VLEYLVVEEEDSLVVEEEDSLVVEYLVVEKEESLVVEYFGSRRRREFGGRIFWW